MAPAQTVKPSLVVAVGQPPVAEVPRHLGFDLLDPCREVRRQRWSGPTLVPQSQSLLQQTSQLHGEPPRRFDLSFEHLREESEQLGKLADGNTEAVVKMMGDGQGPKPEAIGGGPLLVEGELG